MMGWRAQPILQRLFEVYQIPPGTLRFQAYLQLIKGQASGRDLAIPPLGIANPMAKPAVVARLGEWLALGVEDHLAAWILQVEAEWPPHWQLWQSMQISLTYCDDLLGGWTNRALIELEGLLQPAAGAQRWHWLAVPIWSSEAVELEPLRLRVRSALFRLGYVGAQGLPVTLRQVLCQEAEVARLAGHRGINFDPDEAAYTWHVLQPLLEVADRASLVAALFGDQAARQLGYPPLGLSERAGLNWAGRCAVDTNL